jgi:methyltransferase (TIGR00027 family)
MTQAALIENISDTARWVAVFRARESARPDALFQDPFAGRLAGLRGEQIADSLQYVRRHGWAMVTRTHLMDGLIRQQVEHGVEMVVNLAAGLDTRPYRMALPERLAWVEVDLPEILTYKEVMLAGEQTKCRLERIKLDLADGAARRTLFRRLGSQSAKALVIAEGLLVYLTPEQVGALATDLAGVRAFQSWIIDLASPALLRMLQKKVGKELAKGNSVMKFAPEKGPEYFLEFGWRPVRVHSMLHSAARLKRLPWSLRLFSFFPEPTGPPGSRPWSGVCLLERL